MSRDPFITGGANTLNWQESYNLTDHEGGSKSVVPGSGRGLDEPILYLGLGNHCRPRMPTPRVKSGERLSRGGVDPHLAPKNVDLVILYRAAPIIQIGGGVYARLCLR